MNRYKLVQLIEKDLEELKALMSEVSASESDSPLFIDLALGRAKLLYQELELLKEISVKNTQPAESIQNVEEEEPVEDNMPEEEMSDESFADPELEIINFEEQEEGQEIVNDVEPEEEEEEVDDEDVVYNADEDEEDDLAEETDETQINEKVEEEEAEEEPFVEPVDELKEPEEEPEESKQEVDEAPETEPEFEIEHADKIKTHTLEHPAGLREIHIEDLDEDDDEPIEFTPVSKPIEKPVEKPVEPQPEKPVMREIPKPEEAPKEKQVIGEAFQKERSLNDVIAEKQNTETNLGNGPISSLRSAIGLNDRFLFIREIFGNNTDKYNTIIDHLDKLETIQQAVDYLKANLTLQKNETSMKFVDLLKRRFTK